MTINHIDSRPRQYLIGRKQHIAMDSDFTPMTVELLRTIVGNAPLQEIGPADEPLFVATLTAETLQRLQDQFGERVIIEEDTPLVPLHAPVLSGLSHFPPPVDLIQFDSALMPLEGERLLTIRVRDGQGNAVPRAVVYLLVGLFPVKGVTDEAGRVALSLFGETPDTVQALYIKPGNSGHWSRWIDNPSLTLDSENEVTVHQIGEHPPYASFPLTERYGWGALAMGLDRLPAQLRGAGVKVAVIDSGIYHDHSELAAAGGFDFREDASNGTESFFQDAHGHGSHCAGVIAGMHNDQGNNRGIVGFAPDAELHSYRVFPGGRTSWLIQSLQRCVDEGMDVANLSLGSDTESQLLHQAVQQTRQAGVALIAAAGNSASAVMYPAAWPEVLAVAAIGQQGTFPDDSYHARQVGEHRSGDGRSFSARFTCFGSEINLCGPGVAVLSTVPEEGYAAWDGTSMACPHVVGLAALVLAHRSDVPVTRGETRVAKLFEILTQSADDLGLPTAYQGQGLPNALRALNVEAEQPGGGGGGKQEDLLWQQLRSLLSQAVEVIDRAQG